MPCQMIRCLRMGRRVKLGGSGMRRVSWIVVVSCVLNKLINNEECM
jgi:hypothetical protein